MHLRMHNNNFDILIRSVHYSAKLQISKIHRNSQQRVVRRQKSSPRGNQIWIATFSVCDQSSNKRGQKLWYGVKGLVTRNIHVKYESLIYHGSYISTKIKVLKRRSNFKVKVTRSKFMVWRERSCHKEYTCEIWKPCLSRFHKLWPRVKFLKSKSSNKPCFECKGFSLYIQNKACWKYSVILYFRVYIILRKPRSAT